MDIYLPGLVGGVLAFILGGIWFGVLFTKPYQAGVRALDRRKKGPDGIAPPVLLLNLILCLVLGVAVSTIYATTSFGDRQFTGGLLLAILVWVILFVPLMVQDMYLRFPPAIRWITSAYWLAAALVIGATVGLWPQ